MSKKFKSSASSSRVQSTALGGGGGFGGFGSNALSTGAAFGGGFGAAPASQLSYVYEPPDLTNISEPSVVVALKNLQKKDGITKAKALDELLAYLDKLNDQSTSVEDGIVEAWVKLYARTSIDNTRQVRQRSHTLQGRLTSMCGKRIVKSLPGMVGPWLCGLHDNDKLVVRSAQEAIAASFTTEEKRLGLWRVYQKSILEYCRHAVLEEDVNTLSDERTTTTDDAEAKYARTVGSALLTMSRALDVLSKEDIGKEREIYVSTLDSSKTWNLAASKDSFARQAVYNALVARALHLPDSFSDESLKTASSGLIGKGLRTDQTGSSTAFVRSLLAMTRSCPKIWTDFYSNKKRSSGQSLEQFFRNLPAAVASEFWSLLQQTIEALPEDVLQANAASNEQLGVDAKKAFPLVEALHQGMTKREHFRAGQATQWHVYISLVRRASSLNPMNEAALNRLAGEMLCPLVRQYIVADPEKSRWSVANDSGLEIALEAFKLVASISTRSANDCVLAIAENLVDSIQTSLPEQSKGFRESQLKVQRGLQRWMEVKKGLQGSNLDSTVLETVHQTTRSEVRASIRTLQARKGKPFGAVEAIKSAILYLQEKPDAELSDEIFDFMKHDAPKLLGSPSTEYLLPLMTRDMALYDACLRSVLQQDSSSDQDGILAGFVRTSWPSDKALSNMLSTNIKDRLHSMESDKTASFELVNAALASSSTPKDLVEEILEVLVGSLSLEESAPLGLRSLSLLADKNQATFQNLLTTEKGTALAPKLVLLSQTQSDPELKQKAAGLSSKIQTISLKDGNSEGYINTLLTSIHEGLGELSLEVNSLLDLAHQVITASKDNKDIARRLFPSTDQWQDYLNRHLVQTPDQSLAITNDLGGAINLITEFSGEPGDQLEPIKFDSDGLSLVTRAARFTVALINPSDEAKQSNLVPDVSTLCYLSIFNQLASDNSSIDLELPLWNRNDDEIDPPTDLVFRSQKLVQSAVVHGGETAGEVLTWLREQSMHASVYSYYAARAYATLAQEVLEVNPSQVLQSEDELQSIARKPTGTLYEPAVFTMAGQSPAFSKLVNSIIAELSRLDLARDHEHGLRLLVLLNRLLGQATFREDTVSQKHRMVLFVKHLTKSLSASTGAVSMKAEIFTAMINCGPIVKDIFDEFWDDLIDAVMETFKSPSMPVFVLHPALKLYGKLTAISRDTDETNEDFLEAWPMNEKKLQQSLVTLMQLQAAIPNAKIDQPHRISHALIARFLRSAANVDVDADSLYPIISCSSLSLQLSAFGILHRKIPLMQEEIILEAALVKDYKATLPAQLISLLQDPLHDEEQAGRASLASSMILPYLLAWKLTFDHWNGSSYQVQNDYVNILKEASCLSNLLELVYHHMISSRPRPIDASKMSFEDFDVGNMDDPEQDLSRFLCHLYFLSLKHLPSLVRTWWRDECPRALQRPAEEWTEKYMSSRVIEAELGEVSAWIPKQESDTPLEVKVSTRAREVTALYSVDEQMAAIRISLPANYPLSTIVVEDLNRVGAEERKWRTWLINAQGIMNFAPSSGGLGAVTDGLVSWRRNVSGALKGQTECAICYSIVNADRQLPTKRCHTCKHMYHGSCLFKWFKTSSGSTCPLCRNAFNASSQNGRRGLSDETEFE